MSDEEYGKYSLSSFWKLWASFVYSRWFLFFICYEFIIFIISKVFEIDTYFSKVKEHFSKISSVSPF